MSKFWSTYTSSKNKLSHQWIVLSFFSFFYKCCIKYICAVARNHKAGSTLGLTHFNLSHVVWSIMNMKLFTLQIVLSHICYWFILKRIKWQDIDVAVQKYKYKKNNSSQHHKLNIKPTVLFISVSIDDSLKTHLFTYFWCSWIILI